ncbi:hypothetical protein C2G38_2186205 [Gigaspora rosea]|uniref:Uncharacterized protein n=1 Tax=Gigaspora rosea TaxID=44941 RepID=A0A397VA91_9GLOM|nr:hypothetical protein C2G38_2186205 [Gigaspora rosea]
MAKDLCKIFEKWQNDESIILKLNESKSLLENIEDLYYENMFKEKPEKELPELNENSLNQKPQELTQQLKELKQNQVANQADHHGTVAHLKSAWRL